MRSALVVLRSGPADDSDRIWTQSGLVKKVVRLRSASPSGKRFGSRALGMGVDSMRLAIKGIASSPSGAFLAMNPWTAFALRVLGKRATAVVGIYAEPGSRSWRMLRWAIGDALVLTTAEVEAQSWRAAGGNAQSVRYGNTFGYPMRRPKPVLDRLAVFVGGTSDRDSDLIDRLIDEIKLSSFPVDLTLCVGGPVYKKAVGMGTVRSLSRVSNPRFGCLIAEHDVVFIPLSPSARAGGHMVGVGALETGTPFVASDVPGMSGYFISDGATKLQTDRPMLGQLQEAASAYSNEAAKVHEGWSQHYSAQSLVSGIIEKLRTQLA